jgi:hypothetical protein
VNYRPPWALPAVVLAALLVVVLVMEGAWLLTRPLLWLQ